MAVRRDRNAELTTIRDTVESIWVAIVLAFVLRAFMVEAFVIPTGSMAPRLMGEHYELQCPSCKYEFDFGRRRDVVTNWLSAKCPACAFTISRDARATLSKGGDRVLVLKYLYRFAQPQPWDVVVFKNPQDNDQNYIKRLIALPGESIEIIHGDIFIRQGEDQPWRIRRKPHRAQKAMWQIVFDNDYQPDLAIYTEATEDRKPPSWKHGPTAAHWDLTGVGGRQFVFEGAAQPEALIFRSEREDFLPHYGYNVPHVESLDEDQDICTDLKLSFTFQPKAPDAAVSLFLSSFEHRFRADVCADGTVRLLHRLGDTGEDDWKEWGAEKIKPLRVGKVYEVALAHADFRVTVRVADRDVLQSSDEQYPADPAALQTRMARIARERASGGQEGSLKSQVPVPQVQLTAVGGACVLEHIRVMRDVFYTCPRLSRGREWGGPQTRYAHTLAARKDDSIVGEHLRRQGGNLRPLVDDARWRGRGGGRSAAPGWGTTGNPIHLASHPDNPDLDEFFVMGDNSPQSLDSRLWVQAAPSLQLFDADGKTPQYQLGTVPRYNMIGKAFFVYWPSGFRPPWISGPALIPNVGRMRLIR